MRRFILKTLVFIAFCVGLNSQTERLMYSGWENPEYAGKVDEYTSLYQSETNTLLFGSSRTLRHIDPVIFDSLNALHGIQSSTYNMASSAVFFNEEFFLLDQFFNDTSSTRGLHYLLLEMDNTVTLDTAFLFTARGAYYINKSNLGRILNQVVISDLAVGQKIAQYYYHLANLVTHHLSIGRGSQILGYLLYGSRRFPRKQTLYNKGYAPIDTVFPEYPRIADWQERRKMLMTDTSQVHMLFNNLDKIYSHPIPAHAYNPLVLKVYEDFIASMKKKGVTVICVVPLRRGISSELISLYQALPEGHKINITTHPDIKSLKALRYWFDPGHLSLEGSRIYTRMISEQFQDFIRQEQ